MPNLRLRRDVVEEDIIPFPSQGTGWQPRPLSERGYGKHEAEEALENVQEQLTRLSGMVDGDDDRPTAA